MLKKGQFQVQNMMQEQTKQNEECVYDDINRTNNITDQNYLKKIFISQQQKNSTKNS